MFWEGKMNNHEFDYRIYKDQENMFVSIVTDFYKEHIGVIVYFNQLLNSIDLEKWVKVVEIVGNSMHCGIYQTQTRDMLNELGSNYLDCHKCSVNKVRNIIFDTYYREFLDHVAMYIIQGVAEADFQKFFTNSGGIDEITVTAEKVWEMLFEDRWEIIDNKPCLVFKVGNENREENI